MRNSAVGSEGGIGEAAGGVGVNGKDEARGVEGSMAAAKCGCGRLSVNAEFEGLVI